MEKTKFYSYKTNKHALPKGCQLCVKGQKLVLFITGLCPRHCIYCPISDKKYKKDITYANEWPTNDIKEIIKEAELCDAKGAGITGGDPLCTIDRTIKFIKALKKQFGKKFHIHLYTSLDLITKSTLDKLEKAGLDELRIHPNIDNDKLWDKINLIKGYKFDLGIEIPAIPKKKRQIKSLIKHFAPHIKFINLNELEVADNKVNKLLKLGYRTKSKLSYAVKGSEELAKELLKFIEKNHPKLKVHYCTAKLKDKVQMAERIKRRAKNIAQPFDLITDEGTLYRGAIYAKKQMLPTIVKCLSKTFEIPKKLIVIDENEKQERILIASWILEKISKKIKPCISKNCNNIRLAFVEEYPTYDQFPIMIDYIN
ncbi:radical SAM protein [Nanoarchaeota archaeon]